MPDSKITIQNTNPKQDIRSMSKAKLKEWFEEQGEKKFRLKQVHEWLWQKGATSFDEMSNLSKTLREKLSASFDILALEEDTRQVSEDGTIKLRYRLHDGHLIEAVMIPVEKDDRYTVCVSSQVGCSLTCSFCATGKMKRVRNLTGAEIYDQVKMVNDLCLDIYERPLTNIVYMGMGEPMLAYSSLIESIGYITSDVGLGMSPKRITVSTAGIAKAIRRLADDQPKVNLALSLHAADDIKRSKVMPINDSNNLSVLMDALEYYYQTTGNRLSYEYIALRGFNDSLEDAHQLSALCKRFPVKVNIIEYNSIGDGVFSRSDRAVVDDFAQVIVKKGTMVTVRRSRGKDIDAACGQLANKG